MNLDPLREVIDLLKEHKLGEIDVEEDGRRIKVVAAPEPGAAAVFPVIQMAAQSAGEPAAAPDAAGGAPDGAEGPELNEENTIASPIVGTFYRAASPDTDSYVEVGDEFEEGSVLCIVEAMKVMNEIKAERSGKIVEVLVENGQAVEFGQPLFHVAPRA